MNSGLLLVNKPSGLTSHDVIYHLRRALKTKRIGHTGTLDPMATGVLPILVEQATRLSQYLIADEKRYRAELFFGITTDTLDAEGTIQKTREVTVTAEELTAIIHSFRGPQKQVPPMYSAKKVDGKKLYQLAREGVEIERAAADINIFGLEIVKMELPKVTIDVHCSSGTYIRVLAADIGEKAGCGAHLTALIRTAVGPYKLEKCYDLAAIEATSAEENSKKILPMDKVLYFAPKQELTPEDYQRVIHGNPVKTTLKATDLPVSLIYQQEVCAIGRFTTINDEAFIQPKTVMVSP